MKKQKEENKIILKQWVRIFLIIVTIAVMITSIVSAIKALNPQVASRKKLYSYNYKANLNYRVYLKNNNFFTVPYMGMNKQYITSIIDHIEVDTKYDFDSSEALNYEYSYSITATARGLAEDSGGKKVDVWSKDYPISEVQSNSGTGNKFSIAKTVNLDYNYYNQVMTDFRNQFGLSVDARVDLLFNVKVSGGLSGSSEKTLDEKQDMTLQFPLLVQTLKVNTDYVNSGGDTVYAKLDNTKQVNTALLVISLVLFAVSLSIFIQLIKSLLKVTRKSEYIIALNKIMKDYGDIIAETHNMPDLGNYDIVNIKNFADMVDVEEELHSPIIYFEIEENAKCAFLIMHEKTAYRFVLKETDFDHFGTNKRTK